MTMASSPRNNPVTYLGFPSGLFLIVQLLEARTGLPRSFAFLSLPKSLKSGARCQPEGWREES